MVKEYQSIYTLRATQWNKKENNISIINSIPENTPECFSADGQIFVEGILMNLGSELGDRKFGESTWYISDGDYVIWNDDHTFREVIQKARFEKLYELLNK